MHLVETVRPRPVPVRIAEQHGLSLTGHGLAKCHAVAAQPRRMPDAHAQHPAQILCSSPAGLRHHGSVHRRRRWRHLRRIARRRGIHAGLSVHGRRRGHQRRDEMHQPATPLGSQHPANHIPGRDGPHPRLLQAGAVVHLRAALARLLQVLAVTGRIALGQRIELGRLMLLPAAHRVTRGKRAEKEIQLAVGGAPQHGTGRRPAIAPEFARTAAGIRQKPLGQRAQRILGLCIANAPPQIAPVLRTNVRNAIGGALDIHHPGHRGSLGEQYGQQQGQRQAPGPGRQDIQQSGTTHSTEIQWIRPDMPASRARPCDSAGNRLWWKFFHRSSRMVSSGSMGVDSTSQSTGPESMPPSTTWKEAPVR